MIRLVSIVILGVCAIPCGSVHAQRPARRIHHGEPSLFGFGIGIGNYSPSGLYPPGVFDPYAIDGRVYDPYRYGSFRAPDLHDDPYFRWRHKFDSRYPGRYRLRSSRGSAAGQFPTGSSGDLVEALNDSSQRLSRGLSAQRYRDAWMEYLEPDRIVGYARAANVPALRKLVTRYEGVVANPRLRGIASIDGFNATRSLLRRFVDAKAR